MAKTLPEITYAPKAPKLPKRPPFWMIAGGLIAVTASWLPLALSARARSALSTEPRIMLMQDMAWQPKYLTQAATDLFADGRIMRPRVPGTVARGELQEDDHYYRGFSLKAGADGKPQATFYDDFPDQVKVDQALLKRGQDRFAIYCSPCHGLDGMGHGKVDVRATELQQGGVTDMAWAPPANLTDALVRSRAVGHIYNTINVGIRNMPGYGTQVPTADRWAIVAYVRALQISQHALPADVPAGQLEGSK